MKDLQPYKNNLMSLTYEEKIQMSEWLHTQIELERGDIVKQKMSQVNTQFEGFLGKAMNAIKSIGK